MPAWKAPRPLILPLLLALLALLAPAAAPAPLARAQAPAAPAKLLADPAPPRPAAPPVNLAGALDSWRAAGGVEARASYRDEAAIAQGRAQRPAGATPDQGPAPGVFLFGNVAQALSVTTPISEQVVLLVYVDDLGESALYGIDLTDVSGRYFFEDMPQVQQTNRDGLPRYEVWYYNFDLTEEGIADSTKVSFAYGPWITDTVARDLEDGRLENAAQFYPFNIADVTLGAPDPYAETLLNADNTVTFSWQPRATLGDGFEDLYQVCLYDPNQIDPETGAPVQLCSEATPSIRSFTIGPDSFPAEHPVQYGQLYYWYLNVYETFTFTDPVETIVLSAAQSYYQSAVYFLAEQEFIPEEPVTPGGSLPAPPSGKQWNLLVYFAADNDLSDFSIVYNPNSNLESQWRKLSELAPRFDKVNVITFTDFYGKTGSQVCYLSDPSGPICVELGEQNSADPAVLAAFIDTALGAFPGVPHSMLTIAGHGHAVVGVGFDESTPGKPTMAPPQIKQALSSGLKGDRLDLIFYNACLMGNLEIAYDNAPFADYMLVSPTQLWVVNVYEELLAGLQGGADTGAEAAQSVMDAYGPRITSLVGPVYHTLATYDLSAAEAAYAALSDLAVALDGALTADGNDPLRPNRVAIDEARLTAQVYDSSGNNLLDALYDNESKVVADEEDAFVDLADFARALKAKGLAVAQADALLAAIEGNATTPGLVVAKSLNSGGNGDGITLDLSKGTGVAAYFPNGRGTGDQPTYTQLYLYGNTFETFHDNSHWDNFVRNYTSGAAVGGPSPSGGSQSSGGVGRSPGGVGRAPGGVGRAPGGVGRAGRPVAGVVVDVTRYFLPLVR